jgi:hypothetical protein
VSEEDIVGVKKAKQPALRYLLSADPRLHKLSLKKLVDRSKKAASPKRSARSKTTSRRVGDSLRWPWTASPGAIGIASVGVLAAATLLAAGQMSDRSDMQDAVDTPAWEARLSAPAAPVRTEKLAAPSKPRMSEPAKGPSAKPATVKVETAKAETAKPAPAVTLTPTTTVTESAAPGSMTITGCLSKNKDGYWMKDASGADLSKSRSWRTGFFKKSSPRIDVSSSSVQLASYVGQRVSATGVFQENELRARSVRRVAASCN